ncbi:MAG: peroxidase [Bacteroidota bacterium]
MPFFHHLNDLSDITDITWNDRKRLGPLDKASQAIMRGASAFTSKQKETFAAYVSGLNACSFCYGTHAAVAENYGVSATLMESLVTDIDTALVEEKEKPLFHYLKKLTLSPARLTQQDADKVFAAGWKEQDLQDVILIGCLFNFYNRLLDGHGIKGNPAIFHYAGAHLHQRGYSVPWFIGAIKSFLWKRKFKILQAFEANK